MFSNNYSFHVQAILPELSDGQILRPVILRKHIIWTMVLISRKMLIWGMTGFKIDLKSKNNFTI